MKTMDCNRVNSETKICESIETKKNRKNSKMEKMKNRMPINKCGKNNSILKISSL